MLVRQRIAAVVAALVVSGIPYLTHADVSISSKPTQNMSCEAGVCTATAQKAVLNVGDLQTMLASGDAAVNTGSLAKGITVDQPIKWSSASLLTLGATQSIIVNKPVTVAGGGGLGIMNNGTDDGLHFIGEGRVRFSDLNSSLIINGQSYVLLRNINKLAQAVHGDPNGRYAMADNYDASKDGIYDRTPVGTTLAGTFEGLGNVLSGLTIQAANSAALFGSSGGTIRDIRLENASITVQKGEAATLVLTASQGELYDVRATGSVTSIGPGDVYHPKTGGLVSTMGHAVLLKDSYYGGNVSGDFEVGGLVGGSSDYLAAIQDSFAEVNVIGTNSVLSAVGGLVGFLDHPSSVTNSYAKGTVSASGTRSFVGGLIGDNEFGVVTGSYSLAAMSGDAGALVGGLIGFRLLDRAIRHCYWDIETSGTTAGVGNHHYEQYEKGTVGLTTAEFQSGLPARFDPNIWGQSPNFNNGYPYLLANPPQ